MARRRKKYPNDSRRAATAAQGVLDGTFQTQAAAAKHHGVSRQAVNRAIERIKKRERQTVSPGPWTGDDADTMGGAWSPPRGTK